MAEQVRIFVSSPSDTQFERMRIDRVVERLNGEFAGLVQLSTIRWEREFYKADSTFQQQIPQSSDCDIVIAILRHRLGTEIPKDFASMPNGEAYPSGTAYEILTAIDAGRKRGLPDVYVFRYPESPTVRLDDPATAAMVSAQWDRLKAFFQAWFQTQDGHFTAAFQEFHSTDEFEAQVDTLLRKWLADKILKGRPVVWPIETKGSPFRGLAAFDSSHAPVFFGRSREITAATDALKEAAARGLPFLLVIGPSGAGKSSLARAGLVPRLTTPGVVPAVDIWRLAMMRPSASPDGPMMSLAVSLFRGEADAASEQQATPLALKEIGEGDFDTPAALAEVLGHGDESSVRSIVRALDRAGEAERRSAGYERPVRADLVLVIDQLDELFAGDLAEPQRGAFTQLMAALLASGRVWIITTLRADLYERLVIDAGLLDLKTRGATYDLAPPGPAELAEIVRRPADAAALVFDTDSASGERLDDRLLHDADRPDMLPLLQFTLQQLFEQRETAGTEIRLPFRAYQRLGGLAGAIDKEAERAIATVGDAERERLPRLLRQLAAPSQGSDGDRDAGRFTARSVPSSQASYDEPSSRLVRALIDARILLSSGSAQGATIRLAHQRVLESWTRAQEIVAANADFYRVRDEIEEQHRRWQSNNRARDLLIPGGLPLAEAESVRQRYASELSGELNAYIDASSERARARQRRQQVAVAAFAVLTIVAVAAGIWALWQQRAAETALRASRAATSRFLGDLARQRLAEGFVGEAVALARAAVPIEIKDWPRVPTAENALALAMQTYTSAVVRPVVGYVGHEGAVRGAAFSPDGSRLVTWSYDATARVWNVQTGEQLQVFTHGDGVRGARFSTDGSRVLTWSFDGTARLWPVGTTSAPVVLRHDDIVDGAVFSTDQKRVLTWSDDGTARVWDAASGHLVFTLPHKGVVVAARFLDSDRRILTRGFDDADPVRIWNAADGSLQASLKHDHAALGAVVFAHDTRVLTWADDKSARIWDVATGRELVHLPLEEMAVAGATLSTDDSRVAAWSGQVLHVWDAASGRELARIMQDAKINGAALTTAGDRVVTWADDNTVRYWDVATRATLGRLNHTDAVIGATISHDGTHVISWSFDGTAQVWNEGTGPAPQDQARTARMVHGGVVRDATFNQDGTGIWTRSDDGSVRLWSLAGIEVTALRHRAEIVTYVASPKNNLLTTVSLDGTARLWDLAPQKRFAQLEHKGRIVSADFSSDAKSLLTASADRAVALWDVGSENPRLVLQHQAPVAGASFSPDNGPVVAWTEDGTIALWDRATGKALGTVKLPSAARGARYSHDRLLGWSTDGLVRLWDASSGRQLAEFPQCGTNGGLFSEDGRSVLTWCGDGSIRVLHANDGSSVATLKQEQVAGATFSPDGTHVLSWGSDGTIRVSAETSTPSFVQMHHAGVTGARSSQRGERVVSWGGEDNAARVWDAGSGKQIAVLQHTKLVNGAAFGSGGDRVWTWSEDGSARLWETASGKELVRLQHPDALSEAAVVDGGRMLATRSKGNLVSSSLLLWDIQTKEVVASAQTWPAARVSSDGQHYVSWAAGDQTVKVWPLWAPVAPAADRAAQIAARLRPLSPLARCQAHLTETGCDAFPGTSERMLALIADDSHLRLNGRSAARGEQLASADEHVGADVKLEVFVNSRSEVFLFHNKPLGLPLERVEFNRGNNRMVFRFKDGVARDFGIAVDPRLAKYFTYSTRALMVQMDEKTGKPIEGDYYPLLIY
jgi:WD40 repeat protein